jgi:hypothetical protein
VPRQNLLLLETGAKESRSQTRTTRYFRDDIRTHQRQSRRQALRRWCKNLIFCAHTPTKDSIREQQTSLRMPYGTSSNRRWASRHLPPTLIPNQAKRSTETLCDTIFTNRHQTPRRRQKIPYIPHISEVKAQDAGESTKSVATRQDSIWSTRAWEATRQDAKKPTPNVATPIDVMQTQRVHFWEHQLREATKHKAGQSIAALRRRHQPRYSA